MKPIDTSTLGPIKVEPNKMATRAKMVRDALEACAMNVDCTVEEHRAFNKLARIASNETLDLLGRMLK